jgi:hypothetical protein
MSRQPYYWVFASPDGKPTLIKGGATEYAARQIGLEKLSGIDFRVVRLHTTNLQAASAEMRGQVLDETHDLRQATKRQMHERGLRRRLDNSNRGYQI